MNVDSRHDARDHQRVDWDGGIMVDVEEPIDLDRVVFDPIYRRDVIEFLNRQAAASSQPSIVRSSRVSQGIAPASMRTGREAAIAFAQAKP